MYVYFFRLSFHSVKININHLISWLNSVRTPLLSAAQGSAKLVFPPPPFCKPIEVQTTTPAPSPVHYYPSVFFFNYFSPLKRAQSYALGRSRPLCFGVLFLCKALHRGPHLLHLPPRLCWVRQINHVVLYRR